MAIDELNGRSSARFSPRLALERLDRAVDGQIHLGLGIIDQQVSRGVMLRDLLQGSKQDGATDKGEK